MRKIIIIIGLICLFISSNAWAESISDEEKEIIEELDLYMDYSFWTDTSGNEILTVSVEDWVEMLEVMGGENDFSDFLDYEVGEDER